MVLSNELVWKRKCIRPYPISAAVLEYSRSALRLTRMPGQPERQSEQLASVSTPFPLVPFYLLNTYF